MWLSDRPLAYHTQDPGFDPQNYKNQTNKKESWRACELSLAFFFFQINLLPLSLLLHYHVKMVREDTFGHFFFTAILLVYLEFFLKISQKQM
jgi:hypothetical protein